MFCTQCGKAVIEGSQFCANCGARMGANGVAMPKISTATKWQRFANYLVDYMASSVMLGVIYVPAQALFDSPMYPVLINVLGLVLYYIVFEAVWQRTPGKWVTGTKVVRIDGSKPSVGRIVGRSFARLIPFDALSFLARKNGWHDQISGTYVVSDKLTADEVKAIDPAALKGKYGVWACACGVPVAIFFIGLVSTLLVVALNSARLASRDAGRLEAVESIALALELYKEDNGTYPAGDNLSLGVLGTEKLCKEGFATSCETPYAIMPVPRSPASGVCKTHGVDYRYNSLGDDTYELTFCLEGVSDGYSVGVHAMTPNGIDGEYLEDESEVREE